MANKESTQSEEVPRGLERPPASAVVTRENILGGTGDDDKAEAASEEQAQSTSESAPEDSDKKPKRSRGRDRRINRLARDKAQAEEQLKAEREAREALEKELAELRRSAPKPQKPRRNDYDSDDDFAEAYMAWKDAEGSQSTSQRKKTPKPKKVGRLSEKEIVSFLEEGKSSVGDDFVQADKKAQAHEWVLDEMSLEFMMDSDNGHAMFVALSKKPRLAQEIFDARNLQKLELLQELEIAVDPDARAEDKGKSPSRDEQGKFKPAAKTKTKAPPPGPKQERGGPSTQNASLDDLAPTMEVAGHGDLEQYMRARREEHNRRLGRS